jgi:hypothetical protein
MKEPIYRTNRLERHHVFARFHDSPRKNAAVRRVKEKFRRLRSINFARNRGSNVRTYLAHRALRDALHLGRLSQKRALRQIENTFDKWKRIEKNLVMINKPLERVE